MESQLMDFSSLIFIAQSCSVRRVVVVLHDFDLLGTPQDLASQTSKR